MTIDSMDIVYYSFAFLVPGYIMDEIIGLIIPADKEDVKIKAIKCLMYSIINYVIWASWGIRILQNFFDSKSVLYWCVFVVALILTSILSGLFIGCLKGSEKIRHILNSILLKIGLSASYPIPTAWDYKFNKLEQASGVWLLVTLKNGNIYRGWFGNNAIAGSNQTSKDIYMEACYVQMDPNDQWKKVDQTDGIWISADEIVVVEFFKES